MEYFDIIIFIMGIVIVATIIFKERFLKNKNISVEGGELFGVQIDIKEKMVDQIQIVSSPIAACVGSNLTPHLKIKVLDANGSCIEKKKVRLEFYSNSRLMNIKRISGKIVKFSDEEGYVEFDDISLKESGQIEIYIISDNVRQSIDSVYIFPPGLKPDYWNEPIGSEEYMSKLNLVLAFTSKKIMKM